MHPLHPRKILPTFFHVSLAGGALPAFSIRRTAMSLSSFVKNHARVLCGVSGRKKNVTSPTGTVMQPQMMYSQRHPARPWTPLRLSYTATCYTVSEHLMLETPDSMTSTYKIAARGTPYWSSHMEQSNPLRYFLSANSHFLTSVRYYNPTIANIPSSVFVYQLPMTNSMHGNQELSKNPTRKRKAYSWL